MPVHFANGLFDQPWLVAVFIIVGLISNWLMKRRQEQEAARRPEGERPSAPEKPEEEFDLETAMRRLLGEPPPAQSAPPPPPVIPGGQRPPPLVDARQSDAEALRSEPAWQQESEEGWAEDGEQPRPAPPPLRPPPISAAARGTVPTEAQAQAARRFAQSSAATGERSPTVPPGRDAPSTAEPRTGFWRNPRNARQAFVASLVFGSPKGLES
jgi:hypothetical protein